jgi:hyperosmotically inducible protein
MKTKTRNHAPAAAAILIAAMAFAGILSAKVAPDTIEGKVHHALVMLPYLTLFDDLSYRVDGTTVTLFGEVTDPVVKSDAEHAVKRLEGVTAVNDQIEVLPLSPMDNQIRWYAYRAIFGYAPLQRYSMGALPSIHIIVNNGRITLKGEVATAQDKQLAYMRANGVPGAFSVTNDLQVAR